MAISPIGFSAARSAAFNRAASMAIEHAEYQKDQKAQDEQALVPSRQFYKDMPKHGSVSALQCEQTATVERLAAFAPKVSAGSVSVKPTHADRLHEGVRASRIRRSTLAKAAATDRTKRADKIAALLTGSRNQDLTRIHHNEGISAVPLSEDRDRLPSEQPVMPEAAVQARPVRVAGRGSSSEFLIRRSFANGDSKQKASFSRASAGGAGQNRSTLVSDDNNVNLFEAAQAYSDSTPFVPASAYDYPDMPHMPFAAQPAMTRVGA